MFYIMITLKTEDNVFMSYEYKSIFGLIRLSEEAVYIHTIYNKQIGNGSFDEFMDYIEASKKPIILLDVRNGKLWHHLRHARGYAPHYGEVEGTGLKFDNCLIKKPKQND